MGRNSLTGAAIVLLAGALAGAQQPAPSPPQTPPQQKPAEPSTQQPPTFRTGTDLVRVDVAVIDRTVVGTAAVVNEASSGIRLWQSGLVRGYALLILAVCLLACIVPTRRALRVQPTEALRADG